MQKSDKGDLRRLGRCLIIGSDCENKGLKIWCLHTYILSDIYNYIKGGPHTKPTIGGSRGGQQMLTIFEILW